MWANGFYGAFKPLFALSGNSVAYLALKGFGVSYFDRFKNPKTLKTQCIIILL